MASIIAEYRCLDETVWHTVIAAPGETFDELVVAMQKMWPGCEVRLRDASQATASKESQSGVPVLQAAQGEPREGSQDGARASS